MVIVAFRLRSRTRLEALHWALAAVLVLGLSYLFGQIAALLFNDPRPFVVTGILPLIPHTPDNGFPSDHALLAACLIAVVALDARAWSLPLVVLAVLVDWARVGAGLHHVIDVAGSSALVGLAVGVTLLAMPLATRVMTPFVPAGWTGRRSCRFR